MISCQRVLHPGESGKRPFTSAAVVVDATRTTSKRASAHLAAMAKLQRSVPTAGRRNLTELETHFSEKGL